MQPRRGRGHRACLLGVDRLVVIDIAAIYVALTGNIRRERRIAVGLTSGVLIRACFVKFKRHLPAVTFDRNTRR